MTFHLFQRTITRKGKKIKAWYYWYYDKQGKQVRKSCGTDGKPCLLKRDAEQFIESLKEKKELKNLLDQFCIPNPTSLKLSNKYCSVKLGNYPSEIRVSEKVHPYRHFDVIKSYVHDYEFLWNKFCLNFAHNTTYDEMVRNCRIYQVSIQETIGIVTNEKPESQIERSAAQVDETQVINIEKPAQKVDINNCSEVELTELPGINIVKAKKIPTYLVI